MINSGKIANLLLNWHVSNLMHCPLGAVFNALRLFFIVATVGKYVLDYNIFPNMLYAEYDCVQFSCLAPPRLHIY